MVAARYLMLLLMLGVEQLVWLSSEPLLLLAVVLSLSAEPQMWVLASLLPQEQRDGIAAHLVEQHLMHRCGFRCILECRT